MIQLALLIGAATLAGAIGGTLAARWLIRRHARSGVSMPVAPPDPALSAKIDRAASAWAAAQGRPAAKGIAADKMHLIHRIGQRRGWWS